MQQVNSAIAAGTWPVPPSPHLYAWGQNNKGQLGLGTSTNVFSPNQVGSLTNWLKVVGNGYTEGAIKTDGTLWMWGNNANGQLGQGNTTNISSPIQVGTLTNWATFGIGITFAIAIKTNGTLWSWGSTGANTNGSLGLNNNTSYSSPVQVGTLTNWLNISCSSYFSIAIKTDGTLWGWGYNGQGQLGLGNTTNYSSPKQVGSLTNWATISPSQNDTIAIKTDKERYYGMEARK